MTRPRVTRALGVVIASGVAAALAGCGAESPATTGTAARELGSAGSITVYSGQHQQTVGALVQDFQNRTGIEVHVRSGDEADLANQIMEEGAASPADVFFAENPPSLAVLDEKHLLAAVRPTTLALVAQRASSPAGHWVGVSARAAALVYNTQAVAEKDLPTSVLDLGRPELKGRVGVAPSETDFQPVVTRVIGDRGRDAAAAWLSGLKDNARVYDSNESLITAVNRGEVAMGMVDHYYWYRMRDEVGSGGVHSALHHFPGSDPGGLVDVSGAAVLAAGHQQGLAQRFVEYLVSQPAQQIIATSESWEYPLLAGVQSRRLPPLAGITSPVVDLGTGKDALELLQQAGLL
ncbi:MAG: iron(III) transport system substrate-binding protein [Chloroflexota bacterium]|jgi:iron(III) transport system substrate-binding protein|nr:iron(III) transport system substrate-binding protein [Chloroflexota bacterium]